MPDPPRSPLNKTGSWTGKRGTWRTITTDLQLHHFPFGSLPLSRLLPRLPVLRDPLLHGGPGQSINQIHLRRLIQVLLKCLNHSGQSLILWCGERDEFETKLLAAHPADRRSLDADGRLLLRDLDQ